MHGFTRSIKAFEGKLSIIEAVDLKFTFAFSKPLAQAIKHHSLPKVLVPLEEVFQPFWVKLFSTLPHVGSIRVWRIITGQTFYSSLA
jgi:hypothetical protein